MILVAVVQRGALARLLRRAGEQAHRDRGVRRTRRRRADRVLVDPGRLGVDADRVRVAEAALARSHRHGRVPLRELDRVEALGDRVLEVLRRLVLAEADEALVAAVVEDRARHGGLADVAADGADRLDVGGQVGGHEHAAAFVVLDPRPSLREQLVVRLRAAGHDEEVGLDVPPVDRHLGNLAALAPAPRSLGCRRSRKSTIRAISTPAASRSAAACETAIVDREDDGTLGGLDREPVDEAPHCVRQHHADEVVAGEDERLLDDPARDDDAVGAELEQEVAVGDRHEALLEQADRDRGREQLDARLDGAAAELRSSADARRGRRAARRRRRSPRRSRRPTRHPAAAAIAASSPAWPPPITATSTWRFSTSTRSCARAVRVERTEPGGAAQELLVERPELARPDEGLVVEARRRERARRACRSPASGRACSEPT